MSASPTLAAVEDTAEARVRRHFEESIAAKQRVIASCIPAIVRAANLVTDSFRAGNKLLLCGNGGSAADAQHIAAELVSVLRLDFPRPGLPAIALTTDSSLLTASANDFGFEGVFSRQVQALGRAGDVLLGISTSGNSKNVLGAFATARDTGIKTIAFAGEGGGKMAPLVDVAVCVPSRVTQHVQECHIAIGHILCELVEIAMFPRK